MDAKSVYSIIALTVCALASAGEFDESANNSPSTTIEQPPWVMPSQTVRLALLTDETESPNDIAELFESARPVAILKTDPLRDQRVTPTIGTMVAVDPERAQRLLEQARELSRRATNVRDFDRVLAICHQAIEAGPTPAQAVVVGRFGAWVSNARGELLLKAGNEFAAFEAFQEAVILDADCWEALHNRGVTLAANNRPQEALADFARVAELAPHFGSVFRNRGELYASLNEHALAALDFTSAIELEPRSAEHRLARARSQVKLNHTAEAVQDLTAALGLNPQLAEALSLRADIYCKLGYWEQAIEDYQQSLRVDPRSQSTYRGLAWMLATCPNSRYRDGGKAVESAMRALRLGDASDPAILDTLAAAYAEAGQFDEAIKSIEQAIVLAGNAANDSLSERLTLYRQRKTFRMPSLP